MAKVTLQGVSKRYKGENGKQVTAVNNFNLEVRDREFVVFVGPSGCGKSTTLRMIAGLEEISDGDIFIGEKRVNDVAPKNRDIAMVFQNYALYPHMSVHENLAFGLKVRKVPKAEIKKRVEDAAAILGIQDYLDRKPRALSGGQRQRVAVGRALVRQPKVFLFDEPLSNLDAKMRVQMRTEISKLHQQLQTTMIYVTHDQVEAMTMGDRIVVMKDGVIHQIDEPLNLYNNPVNRFVAGFLGSPPMNFINGVLDGAPDGVIFHELKGGTIECKFTDATEAWQFIGKDVVLGVRAEHLKVVTEAIHPGRCHFRAIVDIVEPMGAETNIYLHTGAHTLVCRSEEQFAHSAVGHRFYLELDTAKTYLFEAGSDKRLN